MLILVLVLNIFRYPEKLNKINNFLRSFDIIIEVESRFIMHLVHILYIVLMCNTTNFYFCAYLIPPSGYKWMNMKKYIGTKGSFCRQRNFTIWMQCCKTTFFEGNIVMKFDAYSLPRYSQLNGCCQNNLLHTQRVIFNM